MGPATEIEPLPWYALRIKPRFEKHTAKTLREHGYEELLPTYRSLRRWADRSKVLELPLFPGYLFCRFDLMARVPVLQSPGVVGIVSLGKSIPTVPQHEIEAMRRMVDSGLALEPWPLWNAGDPVIIERGPLAGLRGLLVAAKGHRLVVSVPLMKRSIAAEVDSSWARPLKRMNSPAEFLQGEWPDLSRQVLRLPQASA